MRNVSVDQSARSSGASIPQSDRNPSTARRPFVGVAPFDDHDAADHDLGIQRLQDGAHVGGRARPDTEKRHPFDGRFPQRVTRLTLQEPDAVVEQVETLESLADRIEIGPRVDQIAGMALDLESIGDPDLLAHHLVRVEIAPHVDRAAATARPHLDEVAADVVVADDLELVVQMVEPGASHRRVGEVRAFVPGIARRTRAPALDERFPAQLHLPGGGADLRGIDRHTLPRAVREVEHAQLVIEVQLVEEGRRQQAQIARRMVRELVGMAVVVVVLEEDRLETRLLRHLQQRVLAGLALQAVECSTELRIAVDAFLLDDDRQTEVHR